MNSGTVLAGSLRSNHHHLRHANDAGDRRRVAQKIEIEMLIKRGVDGVRTGNQKQRVTVGRRLHHHLGGEVGAGAGPIIDDELLAELFGQPFRRQPRHGIGGAARRKAAQDVHRARRIGVGARQARHNGQCGCACGEAQKIPAAKSHGDAPYASSAAHPAPARLQELSGGAEGQSGACVKLHRPAIAPDWRRHWQPCACSSLLMFCTCVRSSLEKTC